MTKPLSDFADVHTHNLAAGANAIINLPWGMPLPQQGSYSVAIHPWQADKAVEADWQKLEEMAADTRVVAIGETGIDALKGPSMDTQEEAFRRHIAISEAVGKPLIIHAVRSIPRILALRKEVKPKQIWVIHGFRGKPQLAQELVRAGIHISIGEKYNPGVLQVVPENMLHHESD